MKKVLVTLLGMAVGVTLVQAQGFLQLSSGTSFDVTTNTGTFGNTTVPDTADNYNSIITGISTKSSTAPLEFNYALLFVSTGVGSAGDLANLNDGNWVQLAVYNSATGGAGAALFGTNTASPGNWAMQGGANSVAAIGTGTQPFVNGTTYSLALVGWTSNLGTSWTAVSSQLQTGAWSAAGNFGFVIASVNPTAAAPGNLPSGVWGNSSLVLYSTPVPEPATIGLAGLGGLSMLFLRRRKA
jgi:hypothetical protein